MPFQFFELEGVSMLVTPGLGCILAWGQLVAEMGNIISAPVSAGGLMWHMYFVRIGFGSLVSGGKD